MLDNITGLKWVKFRLFELYGHGLAYPHYWEDETTGLPRTNEIDHKIYSYNLEIGANDIKLSSVPTNEVNAKDIKDYIAKHTDVFADSSTNVQNSTYTLIPGNVISNIFSNFDTFMETVEDDRKKNDRIRDTPNNIVSSRSVLIYDFIINVGGKNVPFLILDLPGREEIVETYINPFLENKYILELLKSQIQKEQYVQELKMMLMVMALNPIAVPVFAPDIVFDFINNCSERLEIFNTPIQMKFEFDPDPDYKDRNQGVYEITNEYEIDNKTKKQYITNYIDKKTNIHRGFKYLEECINKMGTALSYFLDISNDGIVSIKSGRGHGFGYMDPSVSELQYKALAGIHFINRLIMLGKFQILKELFETVVNKKLNDHLVNALEKKPSKDITTLFENLQKSGFKGELLNKVENENKTKKKLQDLIKYDYYLTPLEGIYINENIAGLIKFLASNENMIPDKKDRDKFVERLKEKMLQPRGLNFQYQQKIARIWLTLKNSKNPKEIADRYLLDEKNVPAMLISKITGTEIDYDMEGMKNNYDKISKSYESKKIFNFEHPLITDILTPYLDEIKDYKVFYLFGNYEGTEGDKLKNLKCEHQYSLLENTVDFINVITNPLKN
jgi:hypothetical protein